MWPTLFFSWPAYAKAKAFCPNPQPRTLSLPRKSTNIRLENRIRVGAVSYLNTKPLLYGIEHSAVSRWLHLSVDYPARVAKQLKANEIDLGLVPVAVLPELSTYFIDAEYCIGANGPVGSVGIYSDVPLEEAETLLLDYQSKTSINLARILLQHHWQCNPRVVQAQPGYLQAIKGTTAGVVIGDRAFLQKKQSKYEYDLADAWKKMTGLPFVFAAWVANKELPEGFIDAFNKANEWGLSHLTEVVAANPYPHTDLLEYYTRFISYRLDEQKRKGLQTFLGLMNELPELVF